MDSNIRPIFVFVQVAFRDCQKWTHAWISCYGSREKLRSSTRHRSSGNRFPTTKMMMREISLVIIRMMIMLMIIIKNCSDDNDGNIDKGKLSVSRW